jgi:hypothetical protein
LADIRVFRIGQNRTPAPQQEAYSVTSSALASNDGGAARPVQHVRSDGSFPWKRPLQPLWASTEPPFVTL